MANDTLDLPPLKQSTRYHSLDLWRGVACLFVVVFHAAYYTPFYQAYEHGANYQPDPGLLGRAAYMLQVAASYLWVGVPMFFVISGYCISATIDASRRQNTSLGTYFVRRFRRIYPPYWVAMAATALIIAITQRCGTGLFADETRLSQFPFAYHVDNWLGSVLLIESWRHHVFGATKNYVLGVAWTLCYEEQFYALAGLVLCVMPRRMFTGAVAISVSAVALRVLSAYLDWPVEGFCWDGRWLQFAAGILLYYRINYAANRGRMLVDVGLLAISVLGIVLKNLLPDPVDRSTVLSLAFAWLLGVTHRWDGHLRQLRVLRPLFGAGAICYSMYLTHWVVTKIVGHFCWQHGITGAWGNLLLTVPAATLCSIPVAIWFYRFVEQPCLNRPLARPSTAAPLSSRPATRPFAS